MPAIRRVKAVYVCIGSDLKPLDAAALGNRTEWNATLLHRRLLQPEPTLEPPVASAAIVASRPRPPRIDGVVRVATSERDSALWARKLSRYERGGGRGEPRGDEDYHKDAGVPLTYIETSIVDLAVCRAAPAWFAGWSSSSFSATLAHYRFLDHREHERRGAFNYCGPKRSNSSSGNVRYELADRLRLHTCRLASTYLPA